MLSGIDLINFDQNAIEVTLAQDKQNIIGPTLVGGSGSLYMPFRITISFERVNKDKPVLLTVRSLIRTTKEPVQLLENVFLFTPALIKSITQKENIELLVEWASSQFALTITDVYRQGGLRLQPQSKQVP